MGTRTKRTYNLSLEAVAHVRDLAEQGGPGTSQDRIVEVAIDRLYREASEHVEQAQWTRAREDPAFRSEMRELAAVYADRESWPTE